MSDLYIAFGYIMIGLGIGLFIGHFSRRHH